MRARSGRPLVVTIDGPGGVGKSTAAKRLARQLGVMYLDTGATYRALAYATLQRNLNAVIDVKRIVALARRLPLRLEPAGGSLRVWLAGENITHEIRKERVSEAAASVSQHPEVRAVMVQLQRKLASRRSVVVEGRDTGSVVFPQAQHKFFLDADPEIRARRRLRELRKRYGVRVSLVEVQDQLEVRDGLDRTRHVGPLVKPKGAMAIDTSRLSAVGVVRAMLRHIGRAAPRRSFDPSTRATAFPRPGSGQAGRGLAPRPASRQSRGGQDSAPRAAGEVPRASLGGARDAFDRRGILSAVEGLPVGLHFAQDRGERASLGRLGTSRASKASRGTKRVAPRRR